MLDLRYYDTEVLSSFSKNAKAYITEDTIRWKKSGRWKTGTNTEMSRAFCQNDVWVVSQPKWWNEWENTEWQRNRRWSETERRVNHPACHLFLCSPVTLKLFSLISDYRRQSWILSRMQPQMESKNVFAVWNSEALSFFGFGRQRSRIYFRPILICMGPRSGHRERKKIITRSTKFSTRNAIACTQDTICSHILINSFAQIK